jgi:hypothetical protein
MDIKKYFPISSQTSKTDKLALLAVNKLFNREYNYLEVGSFLGGSLTPFLIDDNCKSILSIDDREKIQPDERGIHYSYEGFTTAIMKENLIKHNFNIDKLYTFDHSINEYKNYEKFYDLAFIDGEHTDIACFRDFIYCFKLLKKNSICMFHDSSIVYKGLQSILIYLDFNDIEYKFIKVSNSEISILFFGDFKNLDIDNLFVSENLKDFFLFSENRRAEDIINNTPHLEKKIEQVQYK